MQFNVEGADVKTGEERRVTVDADDRRDAERRARETGLFVSAVGPSDPASALRITGRRSLFAFNLPSYFSLFCARIILLMLAGTLYSASLTLMVIAGHRLLGAYEAPIKDPTQIGAHWHMLGIGGAMFVVAALCHGVCEACRALRDLIRTVIL